MNAPRPFTPSRTTRRRLVGACVAATAAAITVFLPWLDSGTGDAWERMRGKPGFETMDPVSLVSGFRAQGFGLWACGAASAAAVALVAAIRARTRSRMETVTVASVAALGFAAALLLFALARGPDPIHPGFVAAWGIGLWTCLGLAVAGVLLAALALLGVRPAASSAGRA